MEPLDLAVCRMQLCLESQEVRMHHSGRARTALLTLVWRCKGRSLFSEAGRACFQAVRLALEGKEREKEMVARLLRDLSPELLTRDQVAFGFTRRPSHKNLSVSSL